MKRYKMTDDKGKKYYVFATSVHSAMQLILVLHKEIKVLSVVSN